MNDKEKEKKKIKSRTMFQEAWRHLIRNRGSVIGMIFLIVLVVTVAVIITDTAAILRIESPNDLLSIGGNPEIV